jgi:hypothetical protein
VKKILIFLLISLSLNSFSQQKELIKMFNYLGKGELDNYNKNLNKFIEKGNDTTSVDFLYLRVLEKEKAGEFIASKVYLNKIDCNSTNKIGVFPALSSSDDCNKEITRLSDKLFDAFFTENKLGQWKISDDAQLEKVKLLLINFKEYDAGSSNNSDTKSPFSRYKSQKILKASYEFEKIKDSKQKVDFENFIANNPSEEERYKDRIIKQYELIDFENAMASGDIKSLEAFKANYTKSIKIKEVNGKIEEIIWESTLKANTKAAYDEFILKYPTSKNVAQAKSNLVKIDFDIVKASGKHHEIKNFMFKYKDFDEYYNLAKADLVAIEKDNFMFYFAVDNYTDEQQIKPLEVSASLLSSSDIYTSAYVNDETEFEKQLSSIIKIENVYTDPIANNGKMELNVGIVNIKEFEKLVSKFSDNQTFTFGNNEISLKNKRYEINKMFEKYSTYNLTGNLHNLFFESFDYKISKQDVKPIDNKFYTVDIEVDVTANDRYDEASKILIKYLKLIAMSEKDEQIGDGYPLKFYNDYNDQSYYNFIFRNIESLNLMEVLFKNQTFYVKNFQLYNSYNSLFREGITSEFIKEKEENSNFILNKGPIWNYTRNFRSSYYNHNGKYEHFILPNKIDAITKVYVLDTISDLELNQMKDYDAKRVSSQNFKFKNGGIQFNHEAIEVVVSLFDVVENASPAFSLSKIQNYYDWELPSVYVLNALYDSLYKYHFIPLDGFYQTNERFTEYDENNCCSITYFGFFGKHINYGRKAVGYSKNQIINLRPIRILKKEDTPVKLDFITVYDGHEDPSINFTLDFAGNNLNVLDAGNKESLFIKIDGKEHIFNIQPESNSNSRSPLNKVYIESKTLSFVSKDKTMQFYFDNINYIYRGTSYIHLRGDFYLYKSGEYADETLIRGTFNGTILK